MSDGPPILDQLNLLVRDMDVTLAFYRHLGLVIPEDAGRESGGHHVEVELPNGFVLEFDTLALAAAYDAGARHGDGGGSVIGFALPSRQRVDAIYGELVAAGYSGSQAPCDAFWGARYAVVEDPDGRHVGLMSPVDPSRKGPPPALP